MEKEDKHMEVVTKESIRKVRENEFYDVMY